jgi:hypothetical protein
LWFHHTDAENGRNFSPEDNLPYHGDTTYGELGPLFRLLVRATANAFSRNRADRDCFVPSLEKIKRSDSVPFYHWIDLLSTPYVSSYLLRVLEGMVPGDNGRTNFAEAIVVFGGDIKYAEDRSQSVGPLTLERLLYASRVFHATHLPMLVTGGPISEGSDR